MTTADVPALSYSSVPGRWVLAITVLGSGIAALAATVVNIALPAIGRDFHTGIAALQWVMTSYILTLAAFLLIGGSLGDRSGRRKVYLIGIVWFALASAACGFAPSVVFSSSPGCFRASARRCSRREAWRSWKRRSRPPTGRLDYAGALAAVVFLSGITFAFIEAPTLGWGSPAVLTMASLGAAGLACFLAREHRAAAPMLPLSIFRERQFAAASAVTFIVYGALTGATFLLPLVLQVVSGYSPLASGLALVPLTVIMLALSARSGQLAAKIGPRLQLSVGPVIAGAGLAMLTFSTSGSSYVTSVLPAVVVFGIGLAVTVAPLTATAMGSAPAQHAGIASAVNNDLARFGGLLAVAILPPLAGITGQAYLHPAALAAGFRIAVLISGGLCAAGGLLAAVAISNPPAYG